MRISDWSSDVCSSDLKTKKTQAQRVADIFDLFQMSSGFGAGFMKIVEGRSGKFQLAGRFQADRAIGPGKRNDIPALQHRFPAIAGETHEQCADATFFRIGDRKSTRLNSSH